MSWSFNLPQNFSYNAAPNATDSSLCEPNDSIGSIMAQIMNNPVIKAFMGKPDSLFSGSSGSAFTPTSLFSGNGVMGYSMDLFSSPLNANMNMFPPTSGNDWFTNLFNTTLPPIPDFAAKKDTMEEKAADYKADTKYFDYNAAKTTKLKDKGLSDEFFAEVKDISKRLKCDPADLLAIMNNESGISTKAVNKSSNATGLIQFMPTTAKDLGTSTEALKKMTPEEQLTYVEKYLTRAKSQAGIPEDNAIDGATLYALIFYPKNAAKDVLVESGTMAYSQNSGLDKVDNTGKKGKDQKITKADLAYFVDNQRKALGYSSINTYS